MNAASDEAREDGLAIALSQLGERWIFLIIQTAIDDVTHFEDFCQKLNIARNILSNRLERLVGLGIMVRTVMRSDRRKVCYRLTEKGRALQPVMVALQAWGRQWPSDSRVAGSVAEADAIKGGPQGRRHMS